MSLVSLESSDEDIAAAGLKQKSGRLFGLGDTTFRGPGQIGVGPADVERMTGLTPDTAWTRFQSNFSRVVSKNAMQVL
jgi:hypothetical protein